jgi:ribonuclease HI
MGIEDRDSLLLPPCERGTVNEHSSSFIPSIRKIDAQTFVTRRHDIEGAAIAWTDGSCFPNPGPGGWGVFIEVEGGSSIECFGGEADTTNNRMEMLAIVKAVEVAPRDVPLIVRTDSQLCVLCAVGRWKRKTNVDLWVKLADLCDGRTVIFEWWRGHCGTPGNERADALAGMGRSAVIRQPKEQA